MRWLSGKSSPFPNVDRSFRLLKIATLVAPVIFFAVIEALRRTIFKDFPITIWFDITLFIVLFAAAFFFSRFIFNTINRLEKENLRGTQELVTLNEVYQALEESHILNVLVKRAMDKLVQVTGADCGELYLFNEQSRDLAHVLHVGGLEEAVKREAQLKLRERLMKESARVNQQVIMENLNDVQGPFATAMANTGIGSLTTVPLISAGGISGIACLFSLKPDNFDQGDSDLLIKIGNRVAVAIERARLYDKVQAVAVLEERERISAELHDGLAQVLGYVITKSQATRQLLRKMTTASDYLTEIENVAQEVYTDTREAILGLSTAISGDRSMVSALRDYAARFNQMHGIKTDFIIDDAVPSLAPHAELQAIRIVQEALSNVRKHAEATRVKIRVAAVENGVRIIVEDDGKGFNVEDGGKEDWKKFGIRNMRERANSIHGTMVVESKPESGTKVTLNIPLTPPLTAPEEGDK